MLNMFRSPKNQEIVKYDESSLMTKQFKGLNVQVYGTYEEPLFKAKDIGDLLEMSNIRETISSFNIKQRCDVSLTDAMGREQRTTFLTEQGLYKLLMISRKKIAEQFQDWVCEVVEEIRLMGKYDLQEQLEKQQQLLLTKEQELLKYKEKTYEEIEKTGHIYVIKTDGGTKVGKTKDCVSKRIKGLQTANVSDIEVLLDFPTSNADLLEKCVHYILDRYRCNSNREFFDCDINYIKNIVELCGTVMDTLKSSYQHISKDELKDKLKNKGIEVHSEEGVKVHNEEPPIRHHNAEFKNCHNAEFKNCHNAEFKNWLSENIKYCENEVIKLKDVVETFLGRAVKNECEKSKYKKDVELFVKSKYEHIKHEYGKVRYHNTNDNQNTTYGWKHLKLA